MLAKRINNETRYFARTENLLGLSIRDENIDGMNVMISAWEPTPSELALLNSGATIYLHIVGTQQPPVALTVGEAMK